MNRNHKFDARIAAGCFRVNVPIGDVHPTREAFWAAARIEAVTGWRYSVWRFGATMRALRLTPGSVAARIDVPAGDDVAGWRMTRDPTVHLPHMTARSLGAVHAEVGVVEDSYEHATPAQQKALGEHAVVKLPRAVEAVSQLFVKTMVKHRWLVQYKDGRRKWLKPGEEP